MNKNTPTLTRPPLATLACVNRRCELYGQPGQNTLTVRKTYGKDGLRYLRCRACGAEFSERKNTALWNTKVGEAKAVAVGEHLAEGCSLKGTARLVKVDASTVRRLKRRLGEHGEAFHHERVQALQVEMLEADERHGYAGQKGQPVWEAELIDPQSKFILSHVQGQRDEALLRRLLSAGASRLAKPAMPACFPNSSVSPIARVARAAEVACRSCASVFRAPWPMSRSSSGVKVVG